MFDWFKSKDLKVGDIVDWLDADGCFVCKAKVLGTSGKNALIELAVFAKHPIAVRQKDLLKIDKKNARK